MAGWAVACLEDVRVGQLLSTGAHAVEHVGKMLVVFLEDDLENAVLLREAGRDIVEDVCQILDKFMRLIQNLPLQQCNNCCCPTCPPRQAAAA